ncbi:MAG: RNA 3'-terminal phosphate cyclase [Candidatus Bathyarchaeia archaeon]
MKNFQSLKPLEIRGDILEGGGQILRTAIAFSAVIGIPIEVTRIRARRSPPGLRAQHMAAVSAVSELTGARVEGLSMGSQRLLFIPGQPKAGSFSLDIGTAGSVTLVLQALMPIMAFSPGRVSIRLKGGTNNPMAPPFEFLKEVLLPILKRMGFEAELRLLRRGFYPKGGGIVETYAYPLKSLKPLVLTEEARLERIWGFAYSARLPRHIVERMASSATKILEKAGYGSFLKGVEFEVLDSLDEGCSISPGCGIILFAELTNGSRIVGDALGEPGKPAEAVGKEASEKLIKQLETLRPVDRHLADQLVPWIALAQGSSRLSVCELTLHTLTCIEVVRRIGGLGFEVQGSLGKPSTIACEGMALKNPFLKD